VDEFTTFHEFLENHVTPNPEWDVQRMLLWTEWVRFYLKKNRRFPEAVHEKKFHELITSEFEVSIAFDAYRGPLYVGIQFVA
jgi:hypothetical protein